MRTVLPMICALVAAGATLTGAAQEHGGASHETAKPAAAKSDAKSAHEPAGHGDAKPESAVRTHGAAAPEAPVRAAGTPRPASAQELDAVLARISKKIAERGTPAARPASASAVHAPAPRAAAARVALVWRPAVVWPVGVKPSAAASSADDLGVKWPAALAGTTTH